MVSQPDPQGTYFSKVVGSWAEWSQWASEVLEGYDKTDECAAILDIIEGHKNRSLLRFATAPPEDRERLQGYIQAFDHMVTLISMASGHAQAARSEMEQMRRMEADRQRREFEIPLDQPQMSLGKTF